MPPTTSQMAAARSWIGPKETDAIFSERFDRLDSLDAAILESLRAQVSTLIFSQAASISVEDISINYSENIKAITSLIKEFQEVGGTEGLLEKGSIPVNVTKFHRTSSR